MKLQTITKFDQFTEHLQEAIREGKYPPGTRFPSESQLAEEYGISRLTVNKAVGGMVRMGLLDRKGGRNGTNVSADRHTMLRKIGLVADADPIRHAVLPHLLATSLQEKGYMTSFFPLSRNDSLEKSLCNFLRERPMCLMTDGYYVFPFRLLDRLPRNTRLIFFNRFEGPRRYPASYILPDYSKGGYISARHLLESGRKRLAVFSFTRRPGSTADLYYRGCLRAIEEYGVLPSYYVSDDIKEKDYYKIFSSADRPDGIIAFGDHRAIPILNTVTELGLRVPEDVSVVGYFNTPWAMAYNLTSVTINEELIAENVLKALETGKHVEVVVEPSLVFRSSAPASD